MKEIILTENAPAPIGPYNQAIFQNNTMYLSGQIALDPKNGQLKIENLREEVDQIFSNIKAVLAVKNMNLNHVVKASIFLQSMNDFEAVNAIYAEYFSEESPARECVEVARLPKNVNVEISCIAMI